MQYPTLSLAPDVGMFVSATDVSDGALLAVVLASGPRGEHRVVVHDVARGFAPVHAFSLPNRARSGVTPVQADGDRLIAADDHVVLAIDPRTGAALWQRTFPQRVSLVDTRAGAILLATGDTGAALVLRASDGADAGAPPVVMSRGLTSSCLGPNGEVAVASLRVIEVVGVDGALTRHAIAPRGFGVVDAAAFDDTGRRIIVGTRTGDVVVLDLATGTAAEAFGFDHAIRSVGFHGGVAWALDASGQLRIAGGAAVDLGIATHGGFFLGDAIALSDAAARTFCVRGVPGNEPRFATTAGFPCTAVGITADGALLVGGRDRVVCVTDTVAHLPGAARDLHRHPAGALIFVGDRIRVLAPGSAAPDDLAEAPGTVQLTRDGLVGWSDLALEVWDLARAEPVTRVELGDTWVGETGEVIDFAHLGPDGDPWIHLSDGQIVDARGEPMDVRSPGAQLFAHPDGTRLFRVDGALLTELALPGLAESAPWELPIAAEITTLQLSPSGERMIVFHRDGRLSSVDIASHRGVAIQSPDTSAGERVPNEVFMIDLDTPVSCAFGCDEVHVAWCEGGGISFANAATGALAGRLLLTPDGRDFVVTDGAGVELSGAELPPSIAGCEALPRRAGILAALVRLRAGLRWPRIA